MKLESRFIVATLMAATAFVMTGGLQAANQAVQAEEGATSASPAQESSIPFANMGGIRNWRAIDDQTLYVQDSRRNWYLARLTVPCTDLPFATAIGFETRGVGQLDKFGTLIVGNQRCPLSSFVASGPPPAPNRPGQG